MKNNKQNITLGIVTLAVASLHAQEAPVQTDKHKIVSKSIEIGATGLTKKSYKFGEYSGENQSSVNAGFEVAGGNAYDGGEGTTAFEIKATDLGTTSRSLDASYGNFGKWKVSLGVDELRHNISDTYQTPQQGDMGGNSFKLPTDFGTINGAATGAGTTGANNLSTTQLADIVNKNVHTTRLNGKLGLDYNFLSNLKLHVDYNHLDQSGAKLIGIGSQYIPLDGGAYSLKEGINILMNPTNYKTDTVSLDLNWSGENGQLNGGYFGSFFKDAYNSVNYQTNIASAGTCNSATGSCFANDTFGTAPSNTLHQFNLAGSYAFPHETKINGSLSYGHNTQNEDFAPTTILRPGGTAYNYMTSLPVNSLNGVVNTTHGDLKLTNSSIDKLNLSAALKYNERKNKTPSNTFGFIDIGNTTHTAVSNTPYSNRKTQYELAADYKLPHNQTTRLTLEKEDIKRWCENNAIPGGLECVAAPKTAENKAGINYKIKATDDINVNAGYAYSNRVSVFDSTFKNAIDQSAAMSSPGNAYDVIGFTAIPYANRVRQVAKTGATWQATEKLDLNLNGSYTRDFYNNLYGIRNGFSNSINLDATYALNEKISLSAYVSYLAGERNLNNLGANSATTPANSYKIWLNNLKDQGGVVGLSGEIKALMQGKMDINADVSYSLDKTNSSTQAYYAPSTTYACADPRYFACGSTPTIKTQIITVKLSDSYELSKNSKVAVGYIFQKMETNDYLYNAYQTGNVIGRATDPAQSSKNKGTAIPTNEQAPNYTENMITASYIYTF